MLSTSFLLTGVEDSEIERVRDAINAGKRQAR